MLLRALEVDDLERAKHVLLANGFVQEGKLDREFYREGKYHDICILSIFKDDEKIAGEEPDLLS